MNGRIYDPLLGRFLSADIVVPDPSNLQSYNRFSYVRNNPLSLSDPTGFTESDEEAKRAARRKQLDERTRAVSGASVIDRILGAFDAGVASAAATSAADSVQPETTETPQRNTGVSSGGTGTHGEVNSTDSVPRDSGELRAVTGWRSWMPSRLQGYLDEARALIAPISNSMGHNLITGRRISTRGADPGFRRDYRYLSNYEKGGREFNLIVTLGGFFAPGARLSRTPLYRAVMPDELASIHSTKTFTNPIGIEVKYFSTSPEGAASYARQAAKAYGDGPFTIVKTEIPTSLITPEMRAVVDRGIQTVVVPTEVLPSLTRPIVLPSTPAAPTPGVLIELR